MRARMGLVLAFAMLVSLGAASAAPATPARRLLGSGLGYIPQGCPLTVSVVAQESQPDWFQDAPEIRGSVTLSNPSTYNVPITNVIVQARSSDGMQYSTLAYCSGSTSTVVPFNPVPYTYGTVTCNYRLVLDRNVFGSYGQSGSGRRLQGDGKIQVNFFPGSSGGSGSSGGGYGYFPPPSQRATWSVTAIATISYSNAQCLSAPTPVNTDCWWTWLASWHQKHHISWGRKLMGSDSEQSQHSLSGVYVGEHEREHRQTRHWWFSGRSLLASLWGSANSEHTGSEHEHRHQHLHHHMHTQNRGVMPLTGTVSRTLLGSESHQSSSEHSGHSGEHRQHHVGVHTHHRREFENRGIMPLTEPVSSKA